MLLGLRPSLEPPKNIVAAMPRQDSTHRRLRRSTLKKRALHRKGGLRREALIGELAKMVRSLEKKVQKQAAKIEEQAERIEELQVSKVSIVASIPIKQEEFDTY